MKRIAGAESPVHRSKTKQEHAELERLMRKYSEVQLATLVDRPPEGELWLHETKFDGYRLLGFVSNSTARIRTRNGKDWTESFPSLTAALQKLSAKSAVLDMEAVVVDAEGKSSFQALQSALGSAGEPRKIMGYVFDLLQLDGEDVTKLPLIERKEKLRGLLKRSNRQMTLRYSDHILGDGSKVFTRACEAGLEGIVSKRGDASYVAGRQNSWLKTKCVQRQEFIILGFSGARTGDRALGALYLGYRKDDAIRYAGKVGTGFSMQGARELAELFKKLATEKPTMTRAETKGMTAAEWRSIHWIKPILLCEVAFTEWTQDGRIRHPSFQGLRQDKDAREATKETPVAAPRSRKAVRKPQSASLTVAGVVITHPDRVISKTHHITKGELAEYYAGVARFILPRIVRRPLSLLRCPSGIDGGCFYQRNRGRGLAPDVRPFEFKHHGNRHEYLYIEDEKGLVELIQMGAIEIHPWGASIDSIDYPDRLIFDLDPAPDVPFRALKLAAEDLRRRLRERRLESVLKCTGGKGLHVTVPLMAETSWPRVKAFAATVAQEMVENAPEIYIATMSKAKRKGKIFIDYFRNDYTATAIADYAVRARQGAPVAMPLEWKELKNLRSADQFTMTDALKRLKNKRGDPFSRQKAQRLLAP